MKKILLVSGETSGDQQAAHLVKEIKKIDPNTVFLGMGGKLMQEAGVNIVVNSKHLAVVGIVEIISALPRILNAFKQLKTCLKTEKPDLVILIDYPGFNLRFAKIAKKAGCRVMYYIAPQLWAWGTKRIKWIQRYVDQVGVIFPFELDFYRQYGIDAHFVGNPLVETVQATLQRKIALEHFQVQDKHPIVGLLPGSRKSEINSLLPLLLKFAILFRQEYPSAQFILPLAPHIDPLALNKQIAAYPDLNIHITTNSLYNALSLCNLVAAASGTVTLECGLLEIPTILIYKLHPITYWIAKKITNSSWLGICNIITQQQVMKELIQNDATAINMMKEAKRLLEDKSYLQQTLIGLKKVKRNLNNGNKKLNAAECVISLLQK